jgi:UDP-glucose 4-epimerase
MLDSVYAGRLVTVTGGFGFLGANLSARLVEAGARVRVFCRSYPAREQILEPVLQRVEFCQGDLRDTAALERTIAGCDIVFNLAGRSGSAGSNAAPLADLEVNARGHLNLLEVCRRTNPRVRIVFASSRLVYEPSQSLPVAETAPVGPLSVYGIHKLAAEQYHLLYSRLYDLEAVVLRLTNPYGPMQRPDQSQYGIINWFIHQALSGKPLPVYGEGKQLRDYIHVGDVTRAFMLAGVNPAASGEIFNVGSGQPIAFREMAELVIHEAGRGHIESRPWPGDAAKVETGNFVADISRIQDVLQWQPDIPLREGIADVIQKVGSRQIITA